MAASAPWPLNGNPLEQERHTQMLRPTLSQGSITNAPAVGCVAGASRDNLPPDRQRLTVLHVMA
nr:SAM-dependent methyltransferase [Microvirga tunisiensis]